MHCPQEKFYDDGCLVELDQTAERPTIRWIKQTCAAHMIPPREVAAICVDLIAQGIIQRPSNI